MSSPHRIRQIRRGGATALAAAALAVGAVAVASAATTANGSNGAPPSAGAGPGHPAGDGRPPWGGRFGTAGTVSAVSPTSLTVTGLGGTSTTYVLGATTKVGKDGASASVTDLAKGERVMVRTAGSSSSSGATSGGTASQTATEVDIVSPRFGGTVVSTTGGSGSLTIVVADDDGFWRTIRTSASTTFSSNGATVTNPTISTGTYVSATGSVDADHTTLDASTVSIGRPTQPSANGRHGPGPDGPGGGFGGGPGI